MSPLKTLGGVNSFSYNAFGIVIRLDKVKTKSINIRFLFNIYIYIYIFI